jgi:Protein of unknown function (DUF2470)
MSHGQRHDPVRVLNEQHAEDLLAVGRVLGRHPDATFVRAERIDGDGIDLALDTPEGTAETRVAFSEPVGVTDRRGLRAAFVALAARARAELAGGSNSAG